jgi:hypothetical protein
MLSGNKTTFPTEPVFMRLRGDFYYLLAILQTSLDTSGLLQSKAPQSAIGNVILTEFRKKFYQQQTA